MRRLVVPIAALVIMILFCAWSTARVDAICRESSALLDQAETRCYLGDYPGAEEYVQKSCQCWTRHEGFLGVTLRHTESDDISILYSPLLEACRAEDGEEFNYRSLELRASLRHIARMEKPYYFNVF